jgi:hypothetical protein
MHETAQLDSCSAYSCCTAPGTLAEVFTHLKHHAATYSPKVVPMLLGELQDKGSPNRRNAAYCIGILWEQIPEAVAGAVPQLLQVS